MEDNKKPYSNEIILSRVLKVVDAEGISDSDLSEAFGIELNSIYKVRKGVTSLTIDKLWKLAMLYRVDMNYIFYGPEFAVDLFISHERIGNNVPITYLLLFTEKLSGLPEEERRENIKKAMHILTDLL